MSVLLSAVRIGTRQRSRSRSARPVLLALTALLCLLAQASAIAHTDFAAHGVCEHGELTELSDAPRPSEAQVSPPVRAGLSALAGSATAALYSQDNHCVLAQLLRQLTPGHAPAHVTRAWVQAAALPGVTVSDFVSRRPLDVSPKQSPPA